MKTTTRYTTTILTLALLLTMGGCVKDELHDTPHPDTGKITVTADWTDRGEGVDIPVSWHIVMGDYTGTETGATHSRCDPLAGLSFQSGQLYPCGV